MAATTVKKSHPIRGALYGLILGLGLALIAVGRKAVNLDSIVPIVLVGVGIAIGIVWGMVAPAKKPKGPEPVSTLEPEPESEPSPEPIAEESSTDDIATDSVENGGDEGAGGD